jgi:hypothetical protein
MWWSERLAKWWSAHPGLLRQHTTTVIGRGQIGLNTPKGGRHKRLHARRVPGFRGAGRGRQVKVRNSVKPFSLSK